MNESEFIGIINPISKVLNSTFIGHYAGSNITEGDGITIIGDNIKSLDPEQSDVIFVGKKLAIGKTVFGKNNSLYDILYERYVNELNTE